MTLSDRELDAIREACTSMGCTRRFDGRCVGWHCPYCGGPCSMMGHGCPQRWASRWMAELPTVENTIEDAA